MRQAFKESLKSLAMFLSNNPLAKSYYKGQGVIFMLHDILHDTPKTLDPYCNPSMPFLDRFLIHLKQAGYALVDLDEICASLEQNKPLKNTTHFTLDNGFTSTYTNILPVFKAHNAPFTLYITADDINKPGMLSLKQAQAKKPLCTIGGHAKTHPRLAKLRGKERALKEIKAGNALLKESLGVEVKHFAYPFGRMGDVGLREVEVIKALGLKSAVTTRQETLFARHKDSLACLPRIMLTQHMPLHGIWRSCKHKVA
ncbi:hypothetical protein NHP21005_11770 [Helicobacter sp. NHP21005]|uniref:polysaccharide deacetylase family protein n=1 Tax=Helicobacter felistomachi TaxID=3040201 RepID=UPI00257271B3|nr:polysaccharide deacetylase family protein [Helicobacter sp. NHP21005]BEG57489.1 hypothetical protein NHP21005_11770 [Helicobacter sp. NHP21005]